MSSFKRTILLFVFILILYKEADFSTSSDGYTWLPWGSWTVKCERNCSDKFGIQARRRDCVYCNSKDDCVDVSVENCDFLGKYYDIRPCYDPLYCHGYGIYTGMYGEWEEGECVRMKCGFGNKITRRRCKSTQKTIEIKRKFHSEEFECSDLDNKGDSKSEYCNYDCQKDLTELGKSIHNFYEWTTWSDWQCNDSCLRNPYSAYRTRECMGAISGRTDPLYIPYCINKTMMYRDKMVFDIDHGACSDCTKQWTEWTPWVGCTDVCGSPGRHRNRTCTIGFGKNCTCDKYPFGLICESEEDSCEDGNRVNNCPLVQGNWGEWSAYGECSVTCGWGLKRQHRLCNNPPPQGQGQECVGIEFKHASCYAGRFCPIDGKWHSWDPWWCTVTCGEGVRRRRRQCTNPPALFGGKPCEGAATEEEKCYEVALCPYYMDIYHLPIALKKVLHKRLERSRNSIFANQSSQVVFQCSDPIKEDVTKHYQNRIREVMITWIHNGDIFKERNLDLKQKQIAARIDKITHTLTLQDVLPEDAGVHMCAAIIAGANVTIPIEIYSLAVIARVADHIIPAGNSLNLECNSMLLTQTFENLKIVWYRNKKVYRNGTKLGYTFVGSNLFFSKLRYQDGGVYECHVVDTLRNRSWVTSRVEVKVLSVMALADNAALFTVAGITMFIICILYSFSVAYKYKKYKKLEKKFLQEEELK